MILSGKDIIGRSNTGTGKTAAFGIPAVENICRENNGKVQTLILCPTRELAVQAAEEIKNTPGLCLGLRYQPFTAAQAWIVRFMN